MPGKGITKLERIGVVATGTLVGLGLAALCFAHQVRRFRRAAAVVPEPYEGQGPDLPGWPTA
jgi:hypothetical protein